MCVDRGPAKILNMLMPLQSPEIWDQINLQMHKILQLPVENPVRCYPNLYCAVDEVTTQIATFLAHKRAFTWIKGVTPVFDATLAGFLREGLQIQSVDHLVFEQHSHQANDWVEALPKDTLFVLGFEDHAVTGKKLNLQAFEEALNLKKIFFIRLSHFQLPPETQSLSPYTIWIGPSGFDSMAVVICGSRFRAPEKAIPFYPWKAQSFENRKMLSENSRLVQEFENLFPDSVWFGPHDSRRWDRAILSFSNVTGDLLRTRLLENLKGQAIPTQIMTTHSCFTDSIKLMKSWWTPSPSPEKLRGLIVIEASLLENSQFIPIFNSTLSSIKDDSQWPRS